MIKGYKCEAKKLQKTLEELYLNNCNYSHKGLYNDIDWTINSKNKWVVEKHKGNYILFSTINVVGLNNSYFSTFQANIKLIDEQTICLNISLKTYIIYMMIFIVIIFLLLIFFSIKDENPLFVVYCIMLFAGIKIISFQKKKFRKYIITNFIEKND